MCKYLLPYRRLGKQLGNQCLFGVVSVRAQPGSNFLIPRWAVDFKRHRHVHDQSNVCVIVSYHIGCQGTDQEINVGLGSCVRGLVVRSWCRKNHRISNRIYTCMIKAMSVTWFAIIFKVRGPSICITYKTESVGLQGGPTGKLMLVSVRACVLYFNRHSLPPTFYPASAGLIGPTSFVLRSSGDGPSGCAQAAKKLQRQG